MNLASRLEGVNKRYGTSTLISEYTYEKVAERFVLREIEPVVVQGKTEVVTVYELRPRSDETSSSDPKEFLDLYRRALASYKRGEWELATDLFRQAIARDSEDPVCRHFLDKISQTHTKAENTGGE